MHTGIGVAFGAGLLVLAGLVAQGAAQAVSAGGTPTTAEMPQAGRTLVPEIVGPAPADSRVSVIRLLRARDFSRVDEIIRIKQAAVEQDVRSEPALGRVLNAFDTADPTVTPLIDAWVQADPSSYAARLARMNHGSALAWAARGTAWRDETSAEQVRAMRDHFARVVVDAEAALERNPRLGHGYAGLIGTVIGDPAACVRIFVRASQYTPASFSVRGALAHCLLPRWGGSYEALEALAGDSADHVGTNPSLAALAGFVEWDRGTLMRDSDGDEAVRLYTRAIENGGYSPFYVSRARAHLHHRRYGDSLADLTQALARAPEEPDALMLRAWTLAAMGRTADAAADVRLVTEIDAPNEILAAFREGELERAVADAKRCYDQGDLATAIARLTTAIDLTGGSAEAYFWRGRAWLKGGEEARSLPDFDAAIRLDPRYFQAYQAVDGIFSRRGDLAGAIRAWTRYLALEPTNGRAYVERATAYFYKGDEAEGLADARAACRLGVKEGCEVDGP